MPQAIPLVAGYVTTGVLAAQGAYLWAASIIGGLVSFGASKLIGLDDIPGLEEPGTRANVKGTVLPIPIVYGRREVGGILAQVCTTGKVTTVVHGHDIPDKIDNKYMNVVLVWAEGEIEGVQLLYFGDQLSTADDLDGFFTVEHFTGTDDQVACPGFLAALANTFDAETAAELWSTDHRLRGLAYTWVKLEYDASAWPNGLPVITAELKGRKVLDPRTDTTAWTDNPALIIYDYLTNTRFGRGIDPSEIDTDSFIEAANYCEQSVFIETQAAVPPDIPQAGVTQARYACDAVLNPDDTHLDNLRLLLATCRGALIFSGGLYKLKLDKPETSSFNLTADNIVGGWSIILESSESRFNRVQAQWVDRTKRYQDNYVIVESDTFLEADNAEVLEAKIDLPATCQYLRPAQLAGMALRQSRYSLQCEVTCTIEGLAIEVYDVISVTHELPGWDSQLFRVLGISLESDDQVRIQLQQYADDVYDLDSGNDEDSPPPTSLPSPFSNIALSAFEGAAVRDVQSDGSIRNYAVVNWYSTRISANTLAFRLQWRPEGGTAWETFEAPAAASYVVDLGTSEFYQWTHYIEVIPGFAYEAQIRVVNRLGVESDPYTATIDPAGDQSTPADPLGLHLSADPQGIRLRWTKPDGAARTEIWRATDGTDFAGAARIATVDGSSYIDLLPLATLAAYWLRTVSADGIYSSYSPLSSAAGESYYAGLANYANDAAAGAAGLISGDLYKTSGVVQVKS